MAGIIELIRSEEDGTLSFGNHTLETKTKLADYKFEGDIYKVKTFHEMTRLEKNDTFLYESEPGTTVHHMEYSETGVRFTVEAEEDIQLTMYLREETEYEISVDGLIVGSMATNMSGKLSFSIALNETKSARVSIIQKN